MICYKNSLVSFGLVFPVAVCFFHTFKVILMKVGLDKKSWKTASVIEDQILEFPVVKTLSIKSNADRYSNIYRGLFREILDFYEFSEKRSIIDL